MNGFKVPLLTILTLLSWAVASGWAAGPLPVFVSIAPQAYFVQQIGRDLVNVQVLVEPGADPHTYEPKPQQMVALSKAALYFAVGIEFETARLDKLRAINPGMQVIHTDHGIMKLPMATHGGHQADDAHGEGSPSGQPRSPHLALPAPGHACRPARS